MAHTYQFSADPRGWPNTYPGGQDGAVPARGGVYPDTGGQGGTANMSPLGRGAGPNPTREQGDNASLGTDAPHFRGGPGPAIPQDPAQARGGAHRGAGANPSRGDKLMGSMEKAAGRVAGSGSMVERGQQRKSAGGAPHADDTLL
ncbi:hypothetical protein BD413DRAFT_608881 [Trametes elegans]|nr:hypothetical protein BD413DRAFT_608881 [Trametes elegans]